MLLLKDKSKWIIAIIIESDFKMPFLSFFADKQDAGILLNWLNADDEIAFIVQDKTQVGRESNWKAVNNIEQFTAQKYSLWHIPTGSLPLYPDPEGNQTMPNPWEGWIELHPGADPTIPYFGPGHPAEIRLELWLRHQPYTDVERATLKALDYWYIGDTDLFRVSDFQWIGDRYGAAPSQTWQWWQRLTAWMSQNAIRIGNFEDRDEDTKELEECNFWALPSAFSKLKTGMDYYARGYKLETAIRDAESENK